MTDNTPVRTITGLSLGRTYSFAYYTRRADGTWHVEVQPFTPALDDSSPPATQPADE